MMSRYSLLVILLGVAFTGGCSAYVDSFYYVPHPAVAEIRPAPNQASTQPTTQPQDQQQLPPAMTAYATVIGIRREDSKAGLPLSIEVRLRLDNHGPETVDFDPRSLDLSTADLLAFPPPIVQPAGPVSLAPRQTLIVLAHFPFPPGHSYDNTNLETLQLEWSTMVNGKAISQVVDFHRQHRYVYDPYWDYAPYGYVYPYPYYRPYVGFGGTVIIRR